MKYRPVDPDGDILPVTAPGELLTGPSAAAAALTDRLRLFRGDWWERPETGLDVFSLLSSAGRPDTDAIASAVTDELLSCPDVLAVTEGAGRADGTVFRYARTVLTGEDPVNVEAAFPGT